MNDIARAQLTFQMLTLLQKYPYRESEYQKQMGKQMSGPDSTNS